jgi:cysteine synthase A
MRQARSESFLRAYETPKIVRLASNLHVACFPLMKLLPARFILDRASFDGRLGEGGDIVETSSGSFGLALAMLAAVRNYRLTLVTASSLMDGSFKRRIEHLGASVIVTKETDRRPIGATGEVKDDPGAATEFVLATSVRQPR